MMSVTGEAKGDVWFVYDGDCPICSTAANALRIRKAVGNLHLINAREDGHHPLMLEIKAKGLDLDEGMIIKFQNTCYHGADALHVMALLGTGQGWFNRMNAWLFRSRLLSALCYPPMRAVRNLAIRLKGIPKLRNLEREMANDRPIFQSIFGDAWEHLPPVMQKHYAVRPGNGDVVMVEGALDVERSLLTRALSPLLSMCRALVPYSGNAVPVTVRFHSAPGTSAFYFNREFRFPGHPPCHFRSRMEQIKGSEVVEFMRFGIGWRMRYAWDEQKVRLHHIGYVWRIFGVLIPLPLELLIGRGDAWEEPLSEDSFRMWMGVVHPWFGQAYSYAGTFRVTEVHRA